MWRALRYRLQARRSGGRIRLGRRVTFNTRLDIRGPGRVVVGDDVVIDRAPGDDRAFVTINTHAPDAVVTIGPGARLYGARISCRFAVDVGADVLIEEAGIADTDFHSLHRDRAMPADEHADRCHVRIGDRVSIGARALVAKGVTIGADAVVCPGSVVTRSLPAAAFAAGNPAHVVEPDGDR